MRSLKRWVKTKSEKPKRNKEEIEKERKLC